MNRVSEFAETSLKSVLAASLCFLLFAVASAQIKGKEYSKDLNQDDCRFSTIGDNTYFILRPGYQLVLENKKGGRLVITVLDDTRKIGGVETRVVEEYESTNEKVTEVSRNFFAYCEQNQGVYYFGEEVDNYKDGKIVGHEGSWQATGGNRAGLAMPGKIVLGDRYYQEIAPGIAMDRAEIISASETLRTSSGTYSTCLKVLETTPLEYGEKEFKLYAPGVGLIKDEDRLLSKFGMNILHARID